MNTPSTQQILGDGFAPCSRPSLSATSSNKGSITIAREVKNLSQLTAELTMEEILAPSVSIKSIRHMLIRTAMELGEIEEAMELGEHAKAQREMLDAICKLKAWYWKCTKEGLFAA